MLLPAAIKTEGRPLASEASSASAEEDSAWQLSHAQHERFFPTLASTPVTMLNPIQNTIIPPIRLRMRIERRRGGAREESFENGNLSLPRNPPQADFFLKPPGMLVTASGTRAR
jgi:hypothetical protein